MSKGYTLDPQLEQHFNQLEQQYNLPQNLLKSVAYTESRYNPNATSPVGASGMFQFMPATAKQYGVDTSDPYSSADGAARMYATLLKQNGGDLNKALAGYNWGQGNLNKKGLDNAPKETKNYISQINNLMGNNIDLSQKKNDNIYYNELGKSMSDLHKDQDIVRIYQEMQQAKQMQSQDEDMARIYQEMQQAKQQQVAQQQPQPQQPMNTQQIVNNNASMSLSNNAQLNQQTPASQQSAMQIGIVAPQQQQAPANNNAQIAVAKLLNVKDPATASLLYSQLSPKQQDYVKNILQDQFNRENPNGTSTLGEIWSGVLNASRNFNNSMTQTIASVKAGITGNDTDLKNINNQINQDAQLQNYQDAVNPSTARTVGKVAGDVGIFATGTGIGGLASKATTTLGKVAGLATEGGVMSMAQNPVENAQNASDVLKGKAQQAVVGAVVNPIATIGGEYLLNKAGNAINVVKNANKPLTAEDEKIAQDFANNNIQMSANNYESASPALIKDAQSFTAKNKEMQNFANKQQEQFNTAIGEFKNNLTKPELQNVAKETGLDNVLNDTSNAYHFQAKQIADKIDNLDMNDPNAILKSIAEAKFIADKAKSSNLYDEATKLAPANSSVKIDNAGKVLNDVTDYFNQLKTTSAQSTMKPILNDIKEAVNKVNSGQNTFADIDQLIKEIGSSARQAIKSGDDNGARVYNDFKNALTQDKESYINSLPDSAEALAYKKAYNDAKLFNKNNIQAVKNDPSLFNLFSQFNRSGNVNIPDGLIQKWVQKGQTSKLQNLYDMLPESGKQTVQQGVLNKIIKDASDNVGNIDPQKLFKSYNSYKDATSGNTPLNVVFDPNTKSALDSIMRVANKLNNLSQAKANPINGFQNRDLISGAKNVGAVVAAPHTMGASLLEPILGFVKNKAFLKGLTDPKLQKMLININNLNPSSSAYAKKLAELAGYTATASTNN